jgi:hypothetical protein
VLTESLDILSVLHFILVIKGEEGLGVGVRRIPELEGRSTPAWELLLRPCKHQPREIGPPCRCLGHVIPRRYGSPKPIRGIDHLDVRLLLPLVGRRVIDGEINHSRSRPLGRGWPLVYWCHRLHLWLVLLRLRSRLLPRWLQLRLLRLFPRI